MQTFWTEEKLEIIKIYFGKIKKQELAKMIPDRCWDSIRKKAESLGLKSNRSITNKHSTVNEKFFEELNPISCYYAGLIAADGNIKSNIPYMTLNQKDKTVLEKFKEHIQYSGVISKRINPKKIDNYCHSISITSQKIVDDLYRNFNIIPKKSLILKPPNIIDRYLSMCFIIGYLDGDGYISIVKSKKQKPYIKLGILGTKEMCEWIKVCFDDVGKIYERKDSKNIIYLYMCLCNQAKEIIKKLKDIEELKNIRFERKWNKINEFDQYNLCSK